MVHQSEQRLAKTLLWWKLWDKLPEKIRSVLQRPLYGTTPSPPTAPDKIHETENQGWELEILSLNITPINQFANCFFFSFHPSDFGLCFYCLNVSASKERILPLRDTIIILLNCKMISAIFCSSCHKTNTQKKWFLYWFE